MYYCALLITQGAYDSKHVYTQEFIATVIEEAKNVGIRVIVEFDTPVSWLQQSLLHSRNNFSLVPRPPSKETMHGCRL